MNRDSSKERFPNLIKCPKCGAGFPSQFKTCPNDGAELVVQALQAQQPSIGNYEFICELGSGAMGVIFKARQPVINKTVAIKMMHLHAQSDVMVRRFQREAKAASSLNHENIISVSDFGITVEGQPYMVMEYIDGVSLSEVLKANGPLTVSQALPIFFQICDGMAHAHSSGVLHRDLKPGNIMIIGDLKHPQVRIVDFGIAKLMDDDKAEGGKLTQTGEVFGSPLYMSPEQCMGRPLDPRSDIYSIGCIMFEVFTGAPPLFGNTLVETILKQIDEKPPSMVVASGKKFPLWIESVVAKTLAKDPAARFRTIGELKKSLQQEKLIVAAQSDAARNGGAPSSGIDSAKRNNAPPESNLAKSRNGLKMSIVAVTTLLTVSLLAALSIYEFNVLSGANRTNSNAIRSEVSPNNVGTGLSGNGDKEFDHGINDLVLDSSKAAITAGDVTSTQDKIVRLNGRKLTDAAVDALADKTDIREAQLNETGITNAQIARLVHVPLKVITLHNDYDLSDAALESLSKMRLLEEIDLGGDQLITRVGMAALAKLPKLKILELQLASIDDEGLHALSTCQSLEDLRIANLPITNKGLGFVGKLQNLTDLNLSGINMIDDSGIHSLRNLRSLSRLNLAFTPQVTEAGLKELVGLPIGDLDLTNKKIGALGSSAIQKMSELRRLGLQKAKITPTSLAKIAELPNLIEIDLSGVEVTDDDLVALSGCKSLKKLYLSKDNTRQVSQLTFESLRTSLPKLAVLFSDDPDEAERTVNELSKVQ